MREVSEERSCGDEDEVVVGFVDEPFDWVFALEQEVRQILKCRQSCHAQAKLERTIERRWFHVPPGQHEKLITSKNSGGWTPCTHLVNCRAAKRAARFAAIVPSKHVAGENLEMSLLSPRPDNFE